MGIDFPGPARRSSCLEVGRGHASKVCLALDEKGEERDAAHACHV